MIDSDCLWAAEVLNADLLHDGHDPAQSLAAEGASYAVVDDGVGVVHADEAASRQLDVVGGLPWCVQVLLWGDERGRGGQCRACVC